MLHKIGLSLGHHRRCKSNGFSFGKMFDVCFCLRRNSVHICFLINEWIRQSVSEQKRNDRSLIKIRFRLDKLTVNETANEPPPEDGTMDSAKNLGTEAVYINQIFSQQVLKMVNRLFSFSFVIHSLIHSVCSFREKNVTNFQI